MNDDSGNKARSKDSPLDNKMKKKPCGVCGSVADELSIMTCFQCRETREHIYCARVKLQRVPFMWLCEECRKYSPIPKTAANSRISQAEEAVVDIEGAPSSKTNQVEQGMEDNKAHSIDQATRTNQGVDNQDPIDQTATTSRTDQVVSKKASIEIASSSRTNQVEQVVHHIQDLSPLESSCPVSPSSLVFKPQWKSFLLNRSEYIDLSSDSESEE